MYEASDIKTIETMNHSVEHPARRGIPGSTLKMIAIITMLIDHIGAVLIERGIASTEYWDMPWYYFDLSLRFIGRIAFPIFCFLLVEGFQKTHNRFRYALRLGLFCLIAEIPFDLAFSGAVFDWRHQNVFFTLAIGFCVLWGMSTVKEKKASWPKWAKILAQIIILLVGMLLAELLRTDYAYFGVLYVALLYFFYNSNQAEWLRNTVMIILASVWNLLEVPTALSYIPIHFYNGERGWKLKYVFYLFYPVHLLILALLAYLLFGV